MESQTPPSASRQVWVYILGSFIAAGTFPLICLIRELPHRMTKGPAFLIWTVLSFAPLLLGFCVSIRAQNRLKADINAGSYAPNELESVRAIVNSKTWSIMIGGLLLVSIGCMFAFTFRDQHPHASPWFFLTLGQSLIRLLWTLREPPAANLPPPSDWQERPPLQSQQWGGR